MGAMHYIPAVKPASYLPSVYGLLRLHAGQVGFQIRAIQASNNQRNLLICVIRDLICDKRKARPKKSRPLLTYEKHQIQI